MNRNYRNFINTKIDFDFDKRKNQIVNNKRASRWVCSYIYTHNSERAQSTCNGQTNELALIVRSSWLELSVNFLCSNWMMAKHFSHGKCISDNFFDELFERIWKESAFVINFALASKSIHSHQAEIVPVCSVVLCVALIFCGALAICAPFFYICWFFISLENVVRCEFVSHLNHTKAGIYVMY